MRRPAFGRRDDVRISARNQLVGTVRTVTEGAVMTEVVIDLDAGQEVVAAITTESARRLGLAIGRRVVAVVKSTEVMVAVED
jgi:molybdate transport system regulatory protein